MPIVMKNLKKFRDFYSVVKYKGYTNAAKRLYKTPQAVKKNCTKIEKEMNKTLLTVIGKTVKATPEGEKYYYMLKNLFESDYFKETSREETLSIGVSGILGFSYFKKILVPIIEKMENIVVEVSFGTAFDLEKKLLNHELDMIYSYEENLKDFKIIQEFLEEIDVGYIYKPSKCLVSEKKLIVPDPLYSNYKRLIHREDYKTQGILYESNYSKVLTLLLEDEGVIISSAFAFIDDITRGDLEFLSLKKKICTKLLYRVEACDLEKIKIFTMLFKTHLISNYLNTK